MTAQISVKTILAHPLCSDALEHPGIRMASDENALLGLHELYWCTSAELLRAVQYSTLTESQAKALLVTFSVFCAKQALPFFEAERPDDSSLTYAISEVEDWVLSGVHPGAKVAHMARVAAVSTPLGQPPWGAAWSVVHCLEALTSTLSWCVALATRCADIAVELSAANGLAQREYLNKLLQET